MGIESKSEWIYSERLPIGHWLMPSEVLLFLMHACKQLGMQLGEMLGVRKICGKSV